jgi:hypothetical protein
MKKFIKAVKSFVVNSAACVAPYSVWSPHNGRTHLCWSYAKALEWIAAKNTRVFGVAYIMNFNGEVIASQQCGPVFKSPK